MTAASDRWVKAAHAPTTADRVSETAPQPATSPWVRGARAKTAHAQTGTGRELMTPSAPQPGVPKPAGGLPVRTPQGTAAVWVIGAHGGAGESTVARLGRGWVAADHTWPDLPDNPGCLLVARTHVRGLKAAQAALQQWAGGHIPPMNLLGLVLIADAPGRLSPALRDLARHVEGGAPRCWRIAWSEAWRHGEHPTRLPRAVRTLTTDITQLTCEGTPR